MPGARARAELAEGGKPMLETLSMLAAATGTILWVIAVVLVIAGIVQLVQGQVVAGIALIILGALVGPGGVSLFT